jgi:hypothetical protein
VRGDEIFRAGIVEGEKKDCEKIRGEEKRNVTGVSRRSKVLNSPGEAGNMISRKAGKWVLERG